MFEVDVCQSKSSVGFCTFRFNIHKYYSDGSSIYGVAVFFGRENAIHNIRCEEV